MTDTVEEVASKVFRDVPRASDSSGARDTADAGGSAVSGTVDSVVDAVNGAFATGASRPVEWRRCQLEGLLRFLDEREGEIVAALAADLGKPAFEAWLTEIVPSRDEARHALKHLARWMRPRRVPTALPNLPGASRVVAAPLGTVLVVAPWNYPLCLALVPMVAAIAAGNACVLKPSEIAPATAALLADALPRYLDPDLVRVVTGDGEVGAALAAAPFDRIFYTGGARVARKVLEAAAARLTPVTLELGGRNPCVVEATADIAVAARRIAWGKFVNAGQICVAPDHVLVERAVVDEFVAALVARLEETWGPAPLDHPDLCRLVNGAQFDRLSACLDAGRTLFGGARSRQHLKIAPTVLIDVPAGHPILDEEIFGPILPIVVVEDADEAIARIADLPSPLAVYLFGRDRALRRRVLDGTRSGAVVFNDVVVQLIGPHLPFGGVGASGTGRYHGRAGFDEFSNPRSVLTRPFGFELPVRYPPYGRRRHAWLRRFL